MKTLNSFGSVLFCCLIWFTASLAGAAPELNRALVAAVYKSSDLTHASYDQSRQVLSFRADNEDYRVKLPAASKSEAPWHTLCQADDVPHLLSDASIIRVVFAYDLATKKRKEAVLVMLKPDR